MLRKISAHGLGHLLPPYGEDEAPSAIPDPIVSLAELAAERWQHDLWYRIVEAALRDTPMQVRLDDLAGFDKPAVSRYAATTPRLLRWFDRHNKEKPYGDQVRPFGFLLSYQTKTLPFTGRVPPKPVSTYEGDLGKAAGGCFDRETGRSAPHDQLKSYQDALAQYHLHPESKFHNGDYADRGFTRRRHVRALVTEYVGKEANRWEEQYHLGLDSKAQTEYGLSPGGRERALETARRVADTCGQRELAEAAGVSLSEISAILLGKRSPKPSTLARLCVAVFHLHRAKLNDAERMSSVLDEVRRRCHRDGLRSVARKLRVDPANLGKALSGRRRLSTGVLAEVEDHLWKD